MESETEEEKGEKMRRDCITGEEGEKREGKGGEKHEGEGTGKEGRGGSRREGRKRFH